MQQLEKPKLKGKTNLSIDEDWVNMLLKYDQRPSKNVKASSVLLKLKEKKAPVNADP
jgi:hypothetical protein